VRRKGALSSGAFQETPLFVSMNSKKLDFEIKRRVRGNDPTRSVASVAQVGRNKELPLAANFHAGNAFIPAFDDLTNANFAFKRLTSVD